MLSLVENNAPGNLALWVYALLAFGGLCFVAFRALRPSTRGIPGPLLCKITSLPMIYHGFKGDLHHYIYLLHEKYGDFVCYSPNCISINDSNAYEDLYDHKANTIKPEERYAAFRHTEGISSSFNTTDKEVHHIKRRKLNRGFSEAALENYGKPMELYTDELIKKLAEGVQSGDTGPVSAFNFAYEADCLARDIICEVVSGRSKGFLKGVRDELLKSIRDWEFRVYAFGFIPTLRIFPRLYRPDRLLGDFVRGELKHILSDRGDYNTPKSMLEYFIDTEDKDDDDKLTQGDIIGEFGFLLLGGSVTSSSNLSATLFYLLYNPSAMAKLKTEIFETFQSYADVKLGSKLFNCKYLRACLEESLRLAPPLPTILPRKVLAGGLSTAGKDFREGVLLGIPIFTINRNERYFQDPESFKPERWIPDSTNPAEVKKYEEARKAFQPFSIGPRACPGRVFAIRENALALAKMLYAFDMERVGHEGAFPRHLLGLKTGDVFEQREVWGAHERGPFVRFKPRGGINL